MNAACFIPIKANSERVKGKNLRLLNGRKLEETTGLSGTFIRRIRLFNGKYALPDEKNRQFFYVSSQKLRTKNPSGKIPEGLIFIN